MSLSPEEVDEIVALLDSSGYDELRLDTGRFVLSLRRLPTGWTREEVVGEVRPVGADPGGAPAAPAERAPGEQAGAVERDPAGTETVGVVCPLPGVFYHAPRPGAPPFVTVGQHVEADTVVGLVETMKLMNAVAAGVSGSLVEICVANGEAAAQGAVLMRIRPDTG
ncbi:MAG: acetyl-CoA carboxylase biotin carboxyl carrier protein [Acidimicrobiales bacterium]